MCVSFFIFCSLYSLLKLTCQTYGTKGKYFWTNVFLRSVHLPFFPCLPKQQIFLTICSCCAVSYFYNLLTMEFIVSFAYEMPFAASWCTWRALLIFPFRIWRNKFPKLISFHYSLPKKRSSKYKIWQLE